MCEPEEGAGRGERVGSRESGVKGSVVETAGCQESFDNDELPAPKLQLPLTSPPYLTTSRA